MVPVIMLADFISANRAAIIAGTQRRVASRPSPLVRGELLNGIPVFVDQLIVALRRSQLTDEIDHEQIGVSAGRHGHDLFRTGLTIAQVVHDYGDVCQMITELAVAQNAPIPGDEFRTLNLCLDDAIAEAVTAYSRQREREIAAQGTERLGTLAHELRNLMSVAMLSFDSIKHGRVAPSGSTAAVHSRSLLGIRDLIDRSLAEVRLDAGIKTTESISVAQFLEELEVAAIIHADGRKIKLTVTTVDHVLTIEGDRQILAAAVSNLLHNACKFTPRGGNVSLTTHATADRVLFDVEDECGGLPAGAADELFRPFKQGGNDRTGLGLGLSIARKAAHASAGEIHVRDLPGKGCIFTLDLPRKPPRPFTVVIGGKDARASASGSDAPPDAEARSGGA